MMITFVMAGCLALSAMHSVALHQQNKKRDFFGTVFHQHPNLILQDRSVSMISNRQKR